VKFLLQLSNVRINDQDDFGHTALAAAALLGYTDIVQAILDTGRVYMNISDNDGRTALSLAAERGNLSIVKLLLATPGIEFDIGDKKGQTPVFFAACQRDERVIQLFLNAGICNINHYDIHGRSLPHYCVINGHISIVRMLLEMQNWGIHEDDGCSTGISVLSCAGFSNQEMICLLKMHCACVRCIPPLR
jgi:ankyrin repeat protein